MRFVTVGMLHGLTFKKITIMFSGTSTFKSLDVFHPKRWTCLKFTVPISRCLMAGLPVQI